MPDHRNHLVLCASTSNYGWASVVAGALSQSGIRVTEPFRLPPGLEPKERQACVAALAWQYLYLIAHRTTTAILVVNEAKAGIAHYIGAAVLAEIAMAFYARKPIFLLNDFYGPFMDELVTWGAIPLYGNITPLITTYGTPLP